MLENKVSPKHQTQLSDSCVLWFETSNRYLVISRSIKDIMDVFLDSEDQADFDLKLKSKWHIPHLKGKGYYDEMKELLETANTPIESVLAEIPIIPVLEPTELNEVYRFANTSIIVNYGTLAIQNLIHPQWAHATVFEAYGSSPEFNIFEKDNHLFLFKDQNYIGHYPVTDYHLLQGQFALQIINTLYNKEESDWIATFHASTVCNDKEAIMIIGDSGNGKSTLSAVLMAHGFDVLADDFTPLSAKNRDLYRYPSGISVKEGAFRTLAPMFQDFHSYPTVTSTSKAVRIKYIPPSKPWGETPSHFPCNKIVYVKFDTEAETKLREVSIENILETLIPESWLSPLASNSFLFLEWIKNLKCYELRYSDNTMAISKFGELFDS